MLAAADPCCQEADAFNSEAAACEALACDPTLESCCQRDLEQQAVVARLKARLSIHDRSKERLRVAARVLGQPSHAPPPAAERQSDDDLETDEDDEELGERPASGIAHHACACTSPCTPPALRPALQAGCTLYACSSCSARPGSRRSCSRRGTEA